MKEEIDRAVARRKILKGLEALNRVGMFLTFRNVLDRGACCWVNSSTRSTFTTDVFF